MAGAKIRARGCMMGLMAGDALGASVEGWPQEEIRKLAQSRWNSNLIQDFIPAVHMGTFVPAGEPGQYREAREIRDMNFVPCGPPAIEATARQCARCGMYTDDTNASLALASSIRDCRGVNAAHAARRYAEFWREGDVVRGIPPSAKIGLAKIQEGVDVEVVGLPPHYPFEGGSFANGGAMRISPLGIAYQGADAPTLRRAVEAAVLGTHRHPEAVDFAVVQAAAVQYALGCARGPEDFNPQALLQDLEERCETEAIRKAVNAISAALVAFDGCEELPAVESVVDSVKRPGSGMGFQIASVHMVPCVLWATCRHFRDPRLAVQRAIDLGGDTDTTASMVGAVMGALHGEEWCEAWTKNLENGPRGRDYALQLGEELFDLGVHGPPPVTRK